MFRSKRPILRARQQTPAPNPVSVVGGSASVGAPGVHAGTPVSIGNQLDSQSWNWNWGPWWGYYPYWGYGYNYYCPFWPYCTTSPWGWPNYGYQGTPWPYGSPYWIPPYGY